MSTSPVPLEDIRDLVAWVQWQVDRFASKGEFTSDEVEDMVGQGTLILYEIHAKWDRRKSVIFSAYALSTFQRRMIDWYRTEIASSGRGHVPQSKTGKRGPVVYHGMVSLDDAGPVGDNVAVAFSQDRALTHYDAVEA